MTKKVSFLVFCVLCFSYVCMAQGSAVISKPKTEMLQFFPHTPAFLPILPNALKVIPPSYYTDKWSFFCDKEWKFEKSTGVPFKFRLGSVEQTDYLEGKNGH